MTRPMTAFAATVFAVLAALSLSLQPATAQDAAEIDTSMIPEMTLGNPDAEVTVIEYASFTCPHCASFHADGFKKLKEEYIDTGKINFVYREVYFDRFGLWASIVARCGEGAENRYFGIADMIYENQNEWARQDDPAAIVADLTKYGKTAGLTDQQLNACLSDGENAQALFALWQQRAEEDEINSTPSFLINGEKYSNMPYAEMTEIIDGELGE